MTHLNRRGNDDMFSSYPLLQRSASYASGMSAFDIVSSQDKPSFFNHQSIVHTESLKWQQDAFHRLLHLSFLAREGLIPQREVHDCKVHILDFLVEPSPPHPDVDEWPEFTRDKLLFLQVETLYSIYVCSFVWMRMSLKGSFGLKVD